MLDDFKALPIIESIFTDWKTLLGSDYQAYKNHVYRVYYFSLLLSTDSVSDTDEKMQKIAIAACYHDIGIWADKTLDYLQPSIELVRSYLDSHELANLFNEIQLMIRYHHKITRFPDSRYPLVEIFRRADWIDVTKGKRTFGLTHHQIKSVLDAFPNKDFHKKLVQLTKSEFKKHPFRPMPMFKW